MPTQKLNIMSLKKDTNIIVLPKCILPRKTQKSDKQNTKKSTISKEKAS